MRTENFSQAVAEDARLALLSELGRQNDGRLNDILCGHALEAAGHFRSRDWTRTQLRKMADLGAVTLTEADTVLVAQITEAGVEHILRRGRIEGIKQPAMGV